MKPFIYITIISLFFSSCDKKTDNFLSVKVPIIDICDSISKITLPDNVNLNPKAILNIGDYIVIVNHGTDYILTIYNTQNQQLQYLQRMGRGPKEILNVNQIGIYPDSENKSFYIHDDFKNVLFIYRLNQDLFELNQIEEINNYNAIAIDTNVILGVPSTGPGRYVLENPRKGASIKFGDYSEYEFSEIPTDNTLATGYTVINNGHKFAWASLYGESINIFDYQNPNSPKEERKICYTKPIFNQNILRDQHIIVFSPETTIGFTSLTNSDKYIYALYSGKTFKDFMAIREAALAGNNIGIFDWKGNYVKRLYCKNPIVCISYNNKDKRLYGLKLNQDMEYEIISILCD